MLCSLICEIISDPESESRVEKPHPVYVPRDEAFEETKQSAFATGRLKAVLHNLVPQISATLSSSDTPFNCFSDIDSLYISGFTIKDDSVSEKINSITQMLSESTRLLKYDVPAVIKSMSCSLIYRNTLCLIILSNICYLGCILSITYSFWFLGDRFSWLRDNEFARQALAGVNPVNIELLKVCSMTLISFRSLYEL